MLVAHAGAGSPLLVRHEESTLPPPRRNTDGASNRIRRTSLRWLALRRSVRSSLTSSHSPTAPGSNISPTCLVSTFTTTVRARSTEAVALDQGAMTMIAVAPSVANAATSRYDTAAPLTPHAQRSKGKLITRPEA